MDGSKAKSNLLFTINAQLKRPTGFDPSALDFGTGGINRLQRVAGMVTGSKPRAACNAATVLNWEIPVMVLLVIRTSICLVSHFIRHFAIEIRS
jgi:hypothetical protein